MTYLKPKKKHE